MRETNKQINCMVNRGLFSGKVLTHLRKVEGQAHPGHLLAVGM